MKRFVTLLVMATVVFALILAFSSAAPVAAAPKPAVHPHIHEGLVGMREAKRHLELAVDEFHGHRAKAIEHLDMAIKEAEMCEEQP
jgi:Spy/CpxP family protein refolding chaperone